jgi:hypothetical protein
LKLWNISLLFETLKKLLQENMGYLIYFIQAGIWVPIVFIISNTCPFFQYFLFFFFMNNSCITHASFSATETFQERHLQELGAFILSNIFLCLFPM